ncbi:E3 ubiquitin-protein ligase BRE1B-like isoform X1 [Polypterus senegalus]|uniref:E3 ubiquitin-protein ligase BRE1B-like isoform X1 n=1 Tax=Polypterus senegalus TaxID=55291 RepID=UPI0019626B8D|nr:E3 ubiquitin-protein ligase BRE1B-like isoform X1 [Polypterus senegalus]
MSGAGGGKRAAAGDSPSGPPEKKGKREEKTTTTLIEPIRLGGISSTEEMDLKVLQFKNKKLAERLEQRQAIEDELRERIEKLEKRQATDDATLLIVNRYWRQLDENVKVLLRRYDTEESSNQPQVQAAEETKSAQEIPEPPPEALDGQSESEERSEDVAAPESTEAPPVSPTVELNEPALSFLATLASSSNEEIELQLQERMEFSKRAVSRIVKVFDRLHRRIEALCLKIQRAVGADDANKQTLTLSKNLMEENRRLQDLATQLQEKHHRISLEYNELVDKVTSSETKVSEMETTIEDLQWDIEKLRKREQKLNKHLAEALEQLNSGYHVSGSSGGLQGGQITLNIQKFEMLNNELEQNQELANSRMAELEKLQLELQEAVRQNEKLKMDLRNIPEEVVKETPEYKCLQSQFSLLYNESLQVKTQLDEARALLLTTKNAHLRQIEHMESDELNLQKKLRTEVIQLEDTLAQVRKEYEMLRIEFEQNLAANEQAGPINREMRHLISSLQNHNHQLKGDVQRYKRKLRETQAEIMKVRGRPAAASEVSHGQQQHKLRQQNSGPASVTASSSSTSTTPTSTTPTSLVPLEEIKKEEEAGTPELKKEIKKEPVEETVATMEVKKEKEEEGEVVVMPVEVKKEPDKPPPPQQHHQPQQRTREREKEAERDREREKERERDREREREKEKEREREREKERERQRSEEIKKKDSDALKQLRVELKKAQESQKEMKLLLDMYKSAPKEQRDKVQLMAAERKSKAEAEELRQRIREMEEKERKESKKMADEDALRKIKAAEEQIEHLQKKLTATKQEEEALLSEMDVTGQAFEDMQEQNIRLMQQLREKDDANFKLMSERIKSNQIYKLLREEKDELADQVLALKTQVDSQLLVVQKLEEKEGILQNNLNGIEKELALRTQGLELNKRKAVEAAQLAEDLKVQLEHTQSKLKEIQSSVSDNRMAREKESFNLKKAQEDLSRLRRRLEKQKKVEVYTDADEILQEEINQYKAKLRCPCCNTRDKETVLIKCFHVFCYECLKTRYDTRQRKCPKCNAAFGANDFHRIYIN